jgi:hypothetical protein
MQLAFHDLRDGATRYGGPTEIQWRGLCDII